MRDVQEETFYAKGSTRDELYRNTLELQRSITDQGLIIFDGYVLVRHDREDVSVVSASKPIRYADDPR